MKKTLVTMFVSVVFAFSASAEAITFEKTEHNFGVIAKGDSAAAVYRFVFTNTGKDQLFLTGHNASCGCTVPSYPQNTPIKPGEGGSVTVRYNNYNYPGAIDKTVTMHFRSGKEEGSVVLKIKGEVKEVK